MTRRLETSLTGGRCRGRGRVCTLTWLTLALFLAACGGEVERSHSGGSGGVAGTGGSGGASGGDGGSVAGGAGGSGWTECSTPHHAFCGVPECPEGRPGCSLCAFAKDPGLHGTCVESLDPDEVGYKAADGRIFVSETASITAPFLVLEATFSAGVFLSAHGQAARLAYADRGVWTGAPLPSPETCAPISGIEICGGFCGGCPIGQICTGRSPKHPYGLCVAIMGGVCSLNPEVVGDACESTERCFVFEVEAEHQPMADGRGFCLAKEACQAAALSLPGGGRCE